MSDDLKVPGPARHGVGKSRLQRSEARIGESGRKRFVPLAPAHAIQQSVE